MSCTTAWRARVDAALVGEADRGDWGHLRRHLAQCPSCRVTYNAGVKALYVLEGTGGAPPEPVREHLEADLQSALATPGRVLTWPVWAAWGGALAATLAASLALFFNPQPDPVFASRGAGGGPVAGGFRVFCIRLDQPSPAVRASATSGSGEPARCHVGDRIQFTWSLAAAAPYRYLTLFAVGEDGDLRWYWPRSDSAVTPLAGPAIDQALPGSVDLAARHTPGRYRVYGVFTQVQISRYPIAELVRWLRRFGGPPTAHGALPIPGEVTSAWLELASSD